MGGIELAAVDLKPDGVGSSARLFSLFLGFSMVMNLGFTEGGTTSTVNGE